MMKRPRSRLNNGRSRLGYNKPTLADGYEIRPRINNVQQNYEKYISLARDALTSGDRITAEGFYQHAEHFLRVMNEYKAYLQEKNGQEATTNEEHSEGPEAENFVEAASSDLDSTNETMQTPEQLVA
jgi:hypothetical protein